MNTTTNGASAYTSTNSKCLDFFVLPTRNYDKEKLITLFDNAFKENPLDALRILFNLSDPRNGKGEKELTLHILKHMIIKYPKNLDANLSLIIDEYGCYKTLCELYSRDFYDRKHKATLLPLKILADAISNEHPLAGKWAPSEHGHYNHKTQGYQVSKICNLLKLVRTNKNGISVPDLCSYRKIITGLRTKANIVEQYCCSNNWNDIDFSKVSSKAMMHLSKEAFPNHCGDKFRQWQEDVKKGKCEIKTATIQPYEITRNCRKSNVDNIQELQWNNIVKQLSDRGHLNNALAVVDVSGSMCSGGNPAPIDVAVSLGLLISEVVKGKFHKKFMTFSESPKIVEVKGSTLQKKVNSIIKSDWGYNTNYVKALLQILEYAKLFHLPQDQMPTTLFILTDMEFDTAGKDSNLTPHQVVKQDYESAGYSLPKIVFWNLANRSGGIPVTNRDSNTALVSGFSSSLLKSFLELDPEQAFNPQKIMELMLKDYNPIVCIEDT